MNIPEHYRTSTFNHDFGFKEYITPSGHCDPKRQILMREWADYKNKRHQGKFKVTTKPRVSYFDEQAKITTIVPGPSKYKTEGTMIRRSKSASLRKIEVDLKASKKTYLDEIAAFQAKNKPPAVGKFDLTKYTDLGTKRFSTIKKANSERKFNNFDDAIKLAAELPGPGQFNPHKEVNKLKADRTNYKMWKEKHHQEEKKMARSLSTKMAPNTYTPIVAGTFDSFAADKSRPVSRWSHGPVEIRKGVRSQYKDPSPNQYNTTHQWVKSAGKEKDFGSVNLFNRVSSARSFGVYH